MYRIGWVVLAIVLAVVLGTAAAQEKGQEGKKQKGRIPLGWSKLLKLTPEQKAEIRKLDAEAEAKVRPLFEQIRTIRAQARKAQLGVLTPEQRKTLAKSVLPDEEKKPKE